MKIIDFVEETENKSGSEVDKDNFEFYKRNKYRRSR